MAVCLMSSKPFVAEILLTLGSVENLDQASPVIYMQVTEDDGDCCWLTAQNISTSSRDVECLFASSSIDAIFKLKRILDEAMVMKCLIFVPDSNFGEILDVNALLFVEMFKIEVKSMPISKLFEGWECLIQDSNTDLTLHVTKYLSQIPSREPIQVLRSKLIPDSFIHGFSTRYGGISFYPTQASLNMMYSTRKTDSRLVIAENFRRLCKHIGRDPTLFNLARACHGNDVWVYEKSAPPNYDAIVTNTPGVTIAAPAADCNIVLLADPTAKCCGAVHAGWKGILLKVIPAAVDAMVKEYGSDPSNILASYGPSLSVCCCEFGVEDSKKFVPIHNDVVVWKEGCVKPFLDLRLAVQVQLEESGVRHDNVDDGLNGHNATSQLSVCTKCDVNKDFFSYRRDGAKFGNHLCYISLK